MNDKKKPASYYARTVHNSLVNEFRQNVNSSKHIAPVGDELPDIDNGKGENENSLEALIGSQTPQDWLMFIDDPNLHNALSHLSQKQLELLFLINVKGYRQKEISDVYGITPQAIGGRLRSIYKKIKKYF
jgi:RNA polymerase sigma factor (sigma-70 family)